MTLTTQRLIVFNWIYLAVGIIGWLYPSWAILGFWLMFAIGNGTIGHRYFAHNSFKVSPIGHWILAVWCTISAYSPPSYWQVQHRHHHRHTDRHTDIHAPSNGLWMSLVAWPFSRRRIESVFLDRAAVINHARSLRDPAVAFCTRHYLVLNLAWLLMLGLIDTVLLLAAASAVVLEHARLGLINTLCHLPTLPGNYRNHDTADHSQNNLLLGWLGLGFGWHNNHHHESGRLVLTEKWWELDLEGQIGRLLARL